MPIQDPPSSRMRAGDSPPRRRKSDPEPRRREDDHQPGKGRIGALFTVIVAVLFLGYVFNVGGFATSADQFFKNLNSSAQSENDAVVHVMTVIYPVLGLLAAALVIFGVLHFILGSVRSSKKSRTLSNREVITLDTFKRITEARGIRPRIATQAYALMLPFYRDSMRARLDDKLVDDLHMKPSQVEDVYANLLRSTDRKAPVGEEPRLVTILDLMNAVQNAKRQSLMNSVIRPAARLSGKMRARKAGSETPDEVTSR